LGRPADSADCEGRPKGVPSRNKRRRRKLAASPGEKLQFAHQSRAQSWPKGSAWESLFVWLVCASSLLFSPLLSTGLPIEVVRVRWEIVALFGPLGLVVVVVAASSPLVLGRKRTAAPSLRASKLAQKCVRLTGWSTKRMKHQAASLHTRELAVDLGAVLPRWLAGWLAKVRPSEQTIIGQTGEVVG